MRGMKEQPNDLISPLLLVWGFCQWWFSIMGVEHLFIGQLMSSILVTLTIFWWWWFKSPWKRRIVKLVGIILTLGIIWGLASPILIDQFKKEHLPAPLQNLPIEITTVQFHSSEDSTVLLVATNQSETDISDSAKTHLGIVLFTEDPQKNPIHWIPARSQTGIRAKKPETFEFNITSPPEKLKVNEVIFLVLFVCDPLDPTRAGSHIVYTFNRGEKWLPLTGNSIHVDPSQSEHVRALVAQTKDCVWKHSKDFLQCFPSKAFRDAH